MSVRFRPWAPLNSIRYAVFLFKNVKIIVGMTRKEQAISYFKEGYNCSQAIILTFKEYYPEHLDVLLKASVPFGGGLARMRETCGAVSGMVMVLGEIIGYVTPETGDKKTKLYEITQSLLKQFEEKYGSLTCRALLKLDVKHDEPKPEIRDANFYAKRPCAELIGGAAEILDNYLKNNVVK